MGSKRKNPFDDDDDEGQNPGINNPDLHATLRRYSQIAAKFTHILIPIPTHILVSLREYLFGDAPFDIDINIFDEIHPTLITELISLVRRGELSWPDIETGLDLLIAARRRNNGVETATRETTTFAFHFNILNYKIVCHLHVDDNPDEEDTDESSDDD